MMTTSKIALAMMAIGLGPTGSAGVELERALVRDAVRVREEAVEPEEAEAGRVVEREDERVDAREADPCEREAWC